MPQDERVERQLLGAILIAGHGRDVFKQLTAADFAHGLSGFHGWLYAEIRSAFKNRGDPLATLVRKNAVHLGVRRMAAELYRLIGLSDARVADIGHYVKRLKQVTKFRDQATALVREITESRDRVTKARKRLRDLEERWQVSNGKAFTELKKNG